MATTKPTKTEAKKKKESLKTALKKSGYKMPHGYDISLRKKSK